MDMYTLNILSGVVGLIIIWISFVLWGCTAKKTFRKKLIILGIFLIGALSLAMSFYILVPYTDNYEVLQKWELCGGYEKQTELWASIQNREFYILKGNAVNKMRINSEGTVSTEFRDIEKPKLILIQNYRVWEGDHREELFKGYLVLLPESYKDAYLLWCEEKNE